MGNEVRPGRMDWTKRVLFSAIDTVFFAGDALFGLRVALAVTLVVSGPMFAMSRDVGGVWAAILFGVGFLGIAFIGLSLFVWFDDVAERHWNQTLDDEADQETQPKTLH